jgi:hypothetical protein
MTDVREVETEAFDVGLLDKVVRHRGWELEDDSGHVTTRNQTKQEELPEDLTMALEDYIGDGMAKVTVGAELGHSKEYGCKAQAFVSISVHCNNDDGTIEEVQNILHDKARVFTNQDLEAMMEDRDRYLLQDKSNEGKPAGKLARSGGDATKPAPRTKGKASPKGGVQTKGKVRARPNYKR